jgi:hypothetical protein
MFVDYLPKQRMDMDVARCNEESRDCDITDAEFSGVMRDTYQGKTNVTADISISAQCSVIDLFPDTAVVYCVFFNDSCNDSHG